MTKTPQFDKALDEYFAKLELDEKGGQWRTCRFSGEKFYVRPEDIEFYKKIGVPLPTLSPKERIRRKLAFFNSYHLFKITSAFSEKPIISHYPPNTPYKVYEHQVWFGGDEWSAEEYSRAYDSERGFFEQYKELQLAVPRPNLYVDPKSINSDYSNNSIDLKNCYLVFDAVMSEDCSYSLMVDRSRSCLESFTLINGNTCYEGFESMNLHNCRFAEYSRDSIDCSFIYDCRNCARCFGCTNLRNKQNYFFNEPLSKEAYDEKTKAINLGDLETVNQIKARYKELKGKAIRKENHNDFSINSMGDYLKHCKNCYACFYTAYGENIAYSIGSTKARDCYDLAGGIGTEFSYDTYGGVGNYGVKFSHKLTSCNNVEYSELLTNCHDCYGCIGLKNKSFCIFNKQFEEDDYWKTLDVIKTKMFEAGDYGEFFPPSLAPIPYNISYANSYAGYDDLEVAKRYGYRIEAIPETLYAVEGEVIDAQNLPKDIREVKDDILDKVIFDGKNNKKFRYIKSELDFYRKHGIPLPLEHYSARLAEKRKRFGSIALEFHERKCPKCGKMMQSSYAPDRPEIVYCEQCYNAEVV